jgi:nitrogen fixation protein FixH
MSLLITIFGGMLLTVLLYALGRGVQWSNFWSAVAAAGVPSFAYMAYAAMVRPGLDVVTMHGVAYPTVAVMLFLLYGDKTARTGRMHWAPMLLVGFFVATTFLFAGFVYVAKQGLPPAWAAWLLPNAENGKIHTGFAGVVAHGEDAAKSIAHHRDMEAKLARLGWRVEIVGLDTLRPAHANEVRVMVRDQQGAGVPGLRVSLALGRPGQKAEQATALEAFGDAGYRGLTALPGEGAWLATIGLEGREERVTLEHIVGGE